MTSTTERLSLCQTRPIAYIVEFTYDIRYVKGETNFITDTLSQPSVSAIRSYSIINYKELSEDQALDAEFTRLRHSTSSTLDFQLLKSFENVWYGETCRPDMLGCISQQNLKKGFYESSWARTSTA